MILSLAFVAACLAATSPALARDCIGPNSAARGMPLPPSNATSDEIVQVRVKGMRFAIPRSYFRYPPECGEDQKGILLRALLPDMIPATPENDKRLYNVEGGWGPHVQFIYGDLPNNDLDLGFKVYSRDLDRSLDLPMMYGLKFAARPAKHWPRDVFFEDRDGKITLFIWCSQPQDVAYPGCRMETLYRNEVIGIHFDRKRLDDWRLIRSKVIGLLDGFAVSPQSITPPANE